MLSVEALVKVDFALPTSGSSTRIRGVDGFLSSKGVFAVEEAWSVWGGPRSNLGETDRVFGGNGVEGIEPPLFSGLGEPEREPGLENMPLAWSATEGVIIQLGENSPPFKKLVNGV